MVNPELDKYAQPAQQNEQNVNIQLTVNEVNVILGALGEIPHRVADPVLKKVLGQAQAQLNK